MSSASKSKKAARVRAKATRPQRKPRKRAGKAWDAGAFFKQAGPGFVPITYKRGASVFRQGDAAHAVYYIKKGQVQISIVSKQGKQGVIGLLSQGDFFGESCLAGQPIQIATATAMADAQIIKIERDIMNRILSEDPQLSRMFISFLLSHGIQVEADLVDQLFNSSEKRLARVLLLLANLGGGGDMKRIPHISQEDLAARVGTTRSRISYFMNKFRKLGLIDYNGSLLVHSALLNVIVHE